MVRRHTSRVGSSRKCLATWLLSGDVHEFARLIAAYFLHRHTIAGIVVFDARHVGPNEHQAASATRFEIVLLRAIGDVGRNEAGALVLYSQPESLGAYLAFHHDLLRLVELVAMPDGIGERLFERHLDTKEFSVAPTKLSELGEDFLHRLKVCVATAGQRPLDCVAPVVVGHGSP